MQKMFIGGFVQRHVEVICIWYVLFLMSQFDNIILSLNHRFCKVCTYNMHILIQALSLFYVSLH